MCGKRGGLNSVGLKKRHVYQLAKQVKGCKGNEEKTQIRPRTAGINRV